MRGKSVLVLVFDTTIVSGCFELAGVVMKNTNHSNHIKANRAWPWYLALFLCVIDVGRRSTACHRGSGRQVLSRSDALISQPFFVGVR